MFGIASSLKTATVLFYFFEPLTCIVVQKTPLARLDDFHPTRFILRERQLFRYRYLVEKTSL
jgi:hypothetical protein